MSAIRSFRDLRVWQQAMDLAPRVYELVGRLPREETWALGDQLRRAAVSVPANLAEGHARAHTKEFLQHLSIARGSLAELETLILLAARLQYATAEETQPLCEAISQLRRGLQGLRNSLQGISRKAVPS